MRNAIAEKTATRKTAGAKKLKKADCCAPHESTAHPDHRDLIPRLKRVQGQIAGIERMIDDSRYCVDILIQFRAAMAALRTIEVSMFERHLSHCVSSALLLRDKDQVQEKITELTELLNRRTAL